MESDKNQTAEKLPNNVKMSPLMKWLTPMKTSVEENMTDSIIEKTSVDSTEMYREKSATKGRDVRLEFDSNNSKDSKEPLIEQLQKLNPSEQDNCKNERLKTKRRRSESEEDYKNKCRDVGSEENKPKKKRKRLYDESRQLTGKEVLNGGKSTLENMDEFNNNTTGENKKKVSSMCTETGKDSMKINSGSAVEESNDRRKRKRRSKPSKDYVSSEKITSWLIPSPKSKMCDNKESQEKGNENKCLGNEIVKEADEDEQSRECSKGVEKKHFRGIAEKTKRVPSEVTEKIIKEPKRVLSKRYGNTIKYSKNIETSEEPGNVPKKSSTMEEISKKYDNYKKGEGEKKNLLKKNSAVGGGEGGRKHDELQRKMMDFFGGIIVLKKKVVEEPSLKQNSNSKSVNSPKQNKSVRRKRKNTEDGAERGRRRVTVNERRPKCDKDEKRKTEEKSGKRERIPMDNRTKERKSSRGRKGVKLKGDDSEGDCGKKRTLVREGKTKSSEKKRRLYDDKTVECKNENDAAEWRRSSQKQNKQAEKVKEKNNSEKVRMIKKGKHSSEDKISSNSISLGKRKRFKNAEEPGGNKEMNKTNKENIAAETKLKMEISESNRHSFDKYGIHLPSFSEMKKLKEQLENYSDKVNRAVDYVTSTTIVKEPKRLEEGEKSTKVLGCESLTEKKIEEYFEFFLPHLNAIVKGVEYNWRHEEFIKSLNTCKNIDTLSYSTSIGVFTSAQKDQLAELCSSFFDNYPIEKKTKYYFDVLLPELCLQIFMDVHDMSRDDAVNYLEKRPVDDVA